MRCRQAALSLAAKFNANSTSSRLQSVESSCNAFFALFLNSVLDVYVYELLMFVCMSREFMLMFMNLFCGASCEFISMYMSMSDELLMSILLHHDTLAKRKFTPNTNRLEVSCSLFQTKPVENENYTLVALRSTRRTALRGCQESRLL